MSQNKLFFPERLTVQLLEEGTNHPIENIFLTLILFARAKNDYYLSPALSDSNGIISISKDWVKESIQETRNFFVMDYVSPMEDCFPYVNLRVRPGSEIEGVISARKLYHMENGGLGSPITIQDLQQANNGKYHPHEIQIELAIPNETNRDILIKLRSQ